MFFADLYIWLSCWWMGKASSWWIWQTTLWWCVRSSCTRISGSSLL